MPPSEGKITRRQALVGGGVVAAGAGAAAVVIATSGDGGDGDFPRQTVAEAPAEPGPRV